MFLARDLQHEMDVAIKMLRRPRTRTDKDDAGQGIIEAQRLAAVQHANIVKVYDVGELRSGRAYIVMALAQEKRTADEAAKIARTLQDWVVLPDGRPRYSVRTAAENFAKICRAVGAVHCAGIVHGDLKPRNILVLPGADGDNSDLPLVTDFGVVRSGYIGGTPGYMAPEQELEGKVSLRADVYSLGAVLFFLLTGYDAHPHGERTHRTLPARGIPPDLRNVCERCMNENPDLRYSDAVSVALAVESWLSRHPQEFVASLARGYRKTMRGFLLQITSPILGCIAVIPIAALGAGSQPEDIGPFIMISMVPMWIMILTGFGFMVVGSWTILARTDNSIGRILLIVGILMLCSSAFVTWFVTIYARSRARTILREAGLPSGTRGPQQSDLLRGGWA